MNGHRISFSWLLNYGDSVFAGEFFLGFEDSFLMNRNHQVRKHSFQLGIT